MLNTRILFIAALLFTVTSCALLAMPVHAQFDPPDNVKLIMYQLNPGSGSIAVNSETGKPVLCAKDDPDIAQSYGCTAISEGANRTPPYPFISSTITISIDGVDGPDNNLYAYPYLWDVASQELDMNGSQGNKPPSAVKAQLIAARTYIYQRMTYINQYGTPNNSNQFQVFLPYHYTSTLTSAQQNRVKTEATDRFYLSRDGNSDPIEALYGADNPAETVAGNRPYLQSVADPISAVYGVVDGTRNGGMSSKGVSRWSFGHTSSRGPVASGDPPYPHDINGNGEFWSVRWVHSPQILTHYYTGVHIRDANSGNAIVTPAYRWVPLRMEWSTQDGGAPPSLCRNQPATVQVWVQNSGTTAWNLDATASDRVTLSYSAVKNPGSPAATAQVIGAQEDMLAPGQDALFAVQVGFAEAGSYELRFDMYVGDQDFSTNEPARPWPVYDLLDMTILPCNLDRFVYLPMIQEQAAANSAQ